MAKSRREFLKDSVAFTAGTALTSTMAGALTSCSTKTISIGAIGIRNMGYANIRAFLRQNNKENPDNIRIKALCDVDQNILNEKAAWVEKQTGIKPDLYTDFRKLLEDKEIDAVMIATPDHWHTLISIMAMQAGKHVYVEKPMTRTIGEAILMEKAAKRYKKVVQVGQWQRSGKTWQDAMQYLWSGKLGKVSRVKAWSYTAKDPLPVLPDAPVPQGVDYDMWLGPAPERPFNPNHFHYNFRYYWDYAGGLMTDWGVHMLDFALYGMKVTTPKRVMSLGGKFSRPDDARQVPDTLNVLYDFDDFTVEWEHSITLKQQKFGAGAGIAFQGNNGMMVVTREGWEVRPEHDLKGELANGIPFIKGGGNLDEHVADFLNGIRDHNFNTRANVTVGKNVAILAHMGNLAYRTGEILAPNPETMSFIGNTNANDLIMPEYRAPWKLPKI
jgi:predicted dehydrogenase